MPFSVARVVSVFALCTPLLLAAADPPSVSECRDAFARSQASQVCALSGVRVLDRTVPRCSFALVCGPPDASTFSTAVVVPYGDAADLLPCPEGVRLACAPEPELPE